VFPPGEAREDWKILRALSGSVGRPLPFDTQRELRRQMWEAHPILAEADVVTRVPWEAFGEAGPVASAPFEYPIEDFYRTDPISRASHTMAQCSELFGARRHQASPRTGTHG
jgi:NADH-quinone oxidoreductase subunit G